MKKEPAFEKLTTNLMCVSHIQQMNETAPMIMFHNYGVVY